jgi:HSP20 family protein
MAATPEKNKSKEQQVARNEPARAGSMAPARGGPPVTYGWEPMRRMRDDFERLFEQMFRGWGAPALGPGRDRYWGLDVQETDDKVEVRAEAPGFEPGDFDVQVRGDQLVMCACHGGESSDKESGYREWSRQEFYEAVPLPTGVDANKVEARYRNGILSVTVPKTEESKARRITVQG